MNTSLILRLLLIPLALFLPFTSHAQGENFEFKKITPANFNIVGLIDTLPDAIVIADVGRTYFDYGSNGFIVVFERKTRIHILKQEGSEYATIQIPLYKSENDREKLSTFKGITYNLENGEVIKTKVRDEDKFLEAENENWDHQKIAMPAVRANSIVEYEYEVRSDFIFNLQPWTFQSSIPTQWSEYSVIIPEYFEYKKIAHGYVPFHINDISTTTQKFSVHVEAKMPQQGVSDIREPAHTETFEPLARKNHWVAVNVPALTPEPFTTTVKDYLTSIEFELAVVTMPGTNSKNVMDSWETLNKKLLENEDFGKILKKGNFISDQLPVITAESHDQLAKAKAIYQYVQARVKWNGKYGLSSSRTPRKVFEERSGSVPEINLMLVAILKEAGIDAEPMILSTRDHGKIMEMYPILAKFNYVACVVTIDTLQYIVDATSKLIPFNTLPERCLNGSGLIISKDKSRWIGLLNTEIKSKYSFSQLALAEDGTIKGSCVMNSSGISGYDRRNEYKNKEQKDFIQEFKNDYSNWNVNNFEYKSLDTLDKPFTETYEIETTDAAQLAGDRIYLNIMAGLGMKENPFKLEKRIYPVDFSCPIKETKLIKLSLPAGWIPEELPQSASITLPDKSATFKFIVAKGEGMIQITSTMIISKTVFTAEEYEQLKEFFRLITSAHSEQIVLKKA
jgi:hypothetical protein